MFTKNFKLIRPMRYPYKLGKFYSVVNSQNVNKCRLPRIFNLQTIPKSSEIKTVFNGIFCGKYNEGTLRKYFVPPERLKLFSLDIYKNWLTLLEMGPTTQNLNNTGWNPHITILEFYNNISDKITSQDLRIDRSLSLMSTSRGKTYWKCDYTIKWPEKKTFTAIESKKKEALRITAGKAIDFLCEKSLMNFQGKPLLSGNCLSLVNLSANQSYSTHVSRRGRAKKQDKLIYDENSNEISEPSVEHQNSTIKDGMANLFPTPKNTLGNLYNIVRTEKGSHEIWLSPSFRQVKHKWIFTYKIKWPAEMSFSYTADSKKSASSKCALLVLQYLLENNHISKKGVPNVYDKEDIKALIRSNVPTLKLNQEQIDKLDKISSLYSQEISPIIESYKDVTKLESSFEGLHNEPRTYEQIFLGHDVYKTEETLHLPISDYKEDIIQRIQQNRVLIVKGETGCGKSTRVPQYILEAWSREAEAGDKPCKIVVTEPRRIAAISLADRVASERNERVGKVVGYKVRFKSDFQPKTGRIMYCTNGILLQHFKSDPNLSNFTHIVIDEAHERDINTDLLLNMLKKVLDENPSLKLVIMSATIDTDLFQKYFEGSDLIHIPGFTYPVKSYFLDEFKVNLEKTKKMCDDAEPVVVHDEVVRLLMNIHHTKPEGAILCFLPGWEDIRKIRDSFPNRADVMVLCLHSRLQDLEQWRIFEKSPQGVRKIILATNIAETSVTIDDVVYVVDTGIHKETRFDVDKGSTCIDNHWVSRSSVDQRKGRAGRVKAGECFHLYPKQKLQSLPQFSLPEVLRVSLSKVVLDSKAFNSEITALEFFNKLPSPPNEDTIKLAVDELVDLELIDAKEQLTPLGRVLHHFQLEPKLAKTLVNSVIFKCVSPVVDIITLFSSGTDIFRTGLERKDEIRSLKATFSKTSDHLALMKIFEIWNEFKEEGNERKAEEFCEELWLVPSKMNFMRALKEIHLDYIRNGLKRRVLPITDDFSDDDEMVKAALLSGVGSFLSHKNWDIVKGRMKKDNILVTRTNQKATVTPDSVNFKNINIKSKFLLHINETRSSMRRITLVRETSLLPAVTVLLFSNKELILEEIEQKEFNSQLRSNDQVIIKLGETKIGFLLDREQAIKIMECKLALMSCYDHYIYQLTEGGKPNRTLDTLWHEVLQIMSDFLIDFKNE